MDRKQVVTVNMMHTCPMTTGTVPHVGGPVIGPGSVGVKINGVPIALQGDTCQCQGPPDSIVQGCPGVTINGTPIAVQQSPTAHGGTIPQGVTGVVVVSKNESVFEISQEREPVIYNLQWIKDTLVVRDSKVLKVVTLGADTRNIADGEEVRTKVQATNQQITELSGKVQNGRVEVEWEVEEIEDVSDRKDKILSNIEEDNAEYIYYTKEGEFLGGKDDSKKIYLTTQTEYDKAKEKNEWKLINLEEKLLKENDKEISNSEFRYICYIVKHEAGTIDLEELKCIAFTSYNRSKKVNKKWKNLLSTSYSSVPSKKEMDNEKGNKNKLTRKAVIDVLTGENDITDGAEFWDRTDFIVWGVSETNPYNKTGQNKFKEYKFIEIPKSIYDKYLGAQSSSAIYNETEKYCHNEETDTGTHQHFVKERKKGKEIVYENKIKYDIPEAVFKDENNWKTGDFYYETGVNATYGIVATIASGKSIFWKLSSKTKTSK